MKAMTVAEKVGTSNALSSQRAYPSQARASTIRINDLRSHACSARRWNAPRRCSTTPNPVGNASLMKSARGGCSTMSVPSGAALVAKQQGLDTRRQRQPAGVHGIDALTAQFGAHAPRMGAQQQD